MRIFVEIDRRGKSYRAKIHKGNRLTAVTLPDIQLDEKVGIRIKGVEQTLGNLVTELMCSDADVLQERIDERWQMDVGQYLYNQLFSDINLRTMGLAESRIDLRIVSQDEHICRLPWTLLFNNGVFLSAARWSVSLSTKTKCPDCELPPSPRMLVVAPQPSNLGPTKAEVHLQNLEELLSGIDHRLSKGGSNLRIIRTWEEFIVALSEFEPQIVYYYGHGVGDLNSSHLVFENEANGGSLSKPVADVASILRNTPKTPPLIVYLNCCSGEAGGLLGAGRQLSNFIPAVITNYTLARVSAAQAQGLAIWRSLLAEGNAPHTAVSEMRRNLGHLNLSLADLRWMTPVLHCHYGEWKVTQPEALSPLERDSNWRFKLDRVRQFGQIAYQTTQMLRERKPRSLAYVWYGQEGQGVDLFHQRLRVELQEYLTNTQLYEVQPEWPVEFYSPHRSFEDMFKEAFEVQSLNEIAARIRTQTRGISGRQTLLYVRHSPVRAIKLFDLRMFKRYLEWWDCNLVPLLDKNCFALLGVSFVVGKPAVFVRAIREKERLNELELDLTVLQVLDEMDRLAKHELVDFLKTHNIRLPRQRKDRLLDTILEETGGSYEATLEALKDIAQRAWDLYEDSEVKPNEDDYNYD